MKLGEGVEAAIHSVTMLASLPDGKRLQGSALAAFHGLSSSYLLKHLKALAAAGILNSVPGPTGGYCLARPAEDITLLDVVLAIEGREPAFRCREIRRNGPGNLPDDAFPAPCGISAAMLRAERAYRAALSETRISDLVHDHIETADARVIRQGCAFLNQHERP